MSERTDTAPAGSGTVPRSSPSDPSAVDPNASVRRTHRDEHGRREIPRGFVVRRFAGPRDHAERLGRLRVAHLTDLHVGRVTPHRVQLAAAELTNRQRPDLVVITGDFVCHSTRHLDELTEAVSRIDAPVLCVLGNHDYWSGADEVRWALRRAGAELLDNAHTVLELGHERLQVLGLDDPYTGHADRRAALKGLRSDLPTLGLSHIGEEADPLWEHGVSLVLSGHTHAGQVTVARLHEIAIGKLAGHRYVHGLYGDRGGPGEPDAEPLMTADAGSPNGEPAPIWGPSPAEGSPGVDAAWSDAPSDGDDAVPSTEDRLLPTPAGAVYVGAGIGASVVPLRVGERARREVAVFELGAVPGSFEEHHPPQPPLPGRPPTAAVKARRAAYVARQNARRARAARRRGRVEAED